MQTDIKLGISPLSWMNSDIPSLGSHIAVEHCLSEAALIGYRGVELEDPFRKVMDRLPKLLQDRGLTCVAGWHSTFLLQNPLEQELESLKSHCDTLSKIGSGIVNLADCSYAVHRQPGTPLSKRPKLNDDEVKQLGEKLDTLAEHLRREGFTSSYHHHMGTVIQDAHDIDRLMKATETLGLLFDSGHLFFAGNDPLAVLQKHIGRITHVHYKNIRHSILQQKFEDDSDFFSAIIDGAFTVPGDESDGTLDFGSITKTLCQNDYSGWIVVEAEQDPNKAEPFHYAKLGYSSVNRLF